MTQINSSGHVPRKEIDTQGAAGEALNQGWLPGIFLNNGGNFINNQCQVHQSCLLPHKRTKRGPWFCSEGGWWSPWALSSPGWKNLNLSGSPVSARSNRHPLQNSSPSRVSSRGRMRSPPHFSQQQLLIKNSTLLWPPILCLSVYKHARPQQS